MQTKTVSRVPLCIIEVPSKEAAEEIFARITNGEEFARIAREKSIHPTATQGGYIGEVQLAFLRSELRGALTNPRPGLLVGPVKLPEGYAILRILDKPPDVGPPAATVDSVLASAGVGTVQYSTSVSGYPEAYLARQNALRGIPGWQQDLHAACQARLEGVAGAIDRMQTEAAKGGMPADQMFSQYLLGQLLASEGKMNETIQLWEQAFKTASQMHHPIAQKLLIALGTAYLHRASINDRSTVKGLDPSRIFPMMPGSLHPRADDLQKAVAFFLQVLQQDPDDNEARWLLNVAYMTQGTYPDKVPAKFLISPAKFSSSEDIGRFADVAPAAGLNIATTAGGIIADDFDNDGLLDIVVSQMDDCSSLRFFHNNGNGTFADRTREAGLSEQLGGLNIIQADYNNDGCVDVLVLRGGWEFPRRLSLLRNNCNGTFTDVTSESGLGRVPTATQTAVWTDIDNDGNLDLFVPNENGPANLFLNNGDGTFTDIAHQAGVDRTAFSKAAIAADYNNDGYPDLFVSNFAGDNFLYRNNRNRTFSEVAKQAHVQAPFRSFAAAFLDFDNDGLPDLFVTSYYASTEEFARDFLGLPRNAEGMKLYKNLGDGTFSDVSAQVGLDHVYMPMGANFGDVDNDGFLDIYLGNGNPSYVSRVPNILLRNDGGRNFVDITASSGTGAMEKGHGIAFADFKNSGSEDIAVVMGGAVVGDRHSLRLFQNPGNGNDWLTVHLVGVKSNRSAIGSRIKVTVQNEGETIRTIYRTVGSGASFGASPLEQHIGLGRSTGNVDLEIFWPASRTTQKFSGVAVNEAIQIREFDTEYQKLSRKQFQFGLNGKAELTQVKVK